ncbi:MAG: hypothetical protein J5711_01120 [Bacteroidales bacterium]|nr:hypothetical protein [Bacteroidales bacterium]
MNNIKKRNMASQRCEAKESLKNISETEWQTSIKQLLVFLRWKLRNMSKNGAFSEAVLGMPAVDYFRSEACYKLISGAWQWNPRRSLALQLIAIASNLISKHAEQYANKPETVSLEDLTQEVAAEENLDMTDAAYAIAFENVRGIQELEEYLKAVREYNDYKEISIHLHLTMREVYQLERRMMRRITLAVSRQLSA